MAVRCRLEGGRLWGLQRGVLARGRSLSIVAGSRREAHRVVMRRHLVNGATSSSDEDEATSVPSSSTTSNLFSALDGLDDEKLEEEVSSLRPPPAREPRKVKGALVWIDLEMTGLEVENHTIIEIACLVTDGNLDAKHIGPSLVIHQSEDAIAGMNEWSKEHHAKSGLTERVRQSRVTMEEAEAEVLKFVQKHTEAGRAQLAGNSVHTDYAFLRRYMPRLHAYLDYKLVDVTTVKELARRWFPREFRKRPRKTLQHTAMSDIEESLEELKYYKTRMFKRIKKSNGGY